MHRNVMGCNVYFGSPLEASKSTISGLEVEDGGPDRTHDFSVSDDPCLQEMEQLKTRLDNLSSDLHTLRGESKRLCRNFAVLNGRTVRASKHLHGVQVHLQELEDSYKQNRYLDKLLAFLRCAGHRIRLVPYVLRKEGETTDDDDKNSSPV